MSTLADDLRFSFGMTSPERPSEEDVVSEKSYDRATEAISGMATRIETLHKALTDIATMFENQPEGAPMGSYFQVAYDMRAIARTVLTPKS